MFSLKALICSLIRFNIFFCVLFFMFFKQKQIKNQRFVGLLFLKNVFLVFKNKKNKKNIFGFQFIFF